MNLEINIIQPVCILYDQTPEHQGKLLDTECRSEILIPITKAELTQGRVSSKKSKFSVKPTLCKPSKARTTEAAQNCADVSSSGL